MWVSRWRLGSIVGIQSKHTSLMPEIRYDIPNPVCNKSIPTRNPQPWGQNKPCRQWTSQRLRLTNQNCKSYDNEGTEAVLKPFNCNSTKFKAAKTMLHKVNVCFCKVVFCATASGIRNSIRLQVDSGKSTHPFSSANPTGCQSIAGPTEEMCHQPFILTLTSTSNVNS